MTWQGVNLLYELKSPVHIGYLPSKASVISPTRYYVPGKNFWGAFAKVLTETLFDNTRPGNYRDMGEWFRESVRFTYFYIYDEDNSLLYPKYSEGGLNYGDTSLSKFQNKFIGSFISTAIDKKGTAKDESLHEIEYINPKYPAGKGTKNTKIFGKMFIKKKFSTDEIKDVSNRIQLNEKGITVDDEDPFKVIFVGGELNYGFGKIERLDMIPDKNLMNLKFDLNSDERVCVDFTDETHILGHMSYSKEYQFRGDVELISGRGYKADEKGNEKGPCHNPGIDVVPPRPYFTPGTFIYRPKKVEMDYRGIWHPV